MSDRSRRTAEMKLATLDLKSKIESGVIDKNQFTPQQLAAINAGSDKIPNYTWHHNANLLKIIYNCCLQKFIMRLIILVKVV